MCPSTSLHCRPPWSLRKALAGSFIALLSVAILFPGALPAPTAEAQQRGRPHQPVRQQPATPPALVRVLRQRRQEMADRPAELPGATPEMLIIAPLVSVSANSLLCILPIIGSAVLLIALYLARRLNDLFRVRRSVSHRQEPAAAGGRGGMAWQLHLIEHALEHAPDGVAILDQQGRHLYANAAFCKQLGYSHAEMLACTVADVDPTLSPQVWRSIWENMRQKGANIAETYHRRKDGELIPVEITSNYIEADDQPFLCAFVRDMSEHRQIEAALQQRVRELHALRATMTELLHDLDMQTTLQTILSRAVDICEAERGELSLYDPHQNDLHVVANYNMDQETTGTRQALEEGAMGQVVQTRQPLIVADYNTWSKRLERYTYSKSYAVVLVPLLDAEQLIGVIGVGRLLSKHPFTQADVELLTLFAQQAAIAIRNARHFAEAQHLATTDQLTGLTNRAQFLQRASLAYTQARELGRPLAVLLLDVDNFKRVNDLHGHTTGDHVLREIARRCLAALRTGDSVGRYGGEEIALVLPDTPFEAALQFAERLRQTLDQRPIETPDALLHITASLGLAMLDPFEAAGGPPGLEALIDRADQALHAAKQRGKNCVVRWDGGLVRTRVSGAVGRPTESRGRAEVLLHIATALHSDLQFDTVLRNVCTETLRTLNVSAAFVWLYDDPTNLLYPVAVAGVERAYIERSEPIPPSVYSPTVYQGNLQIVPNVQELTERLPNAAIVHELNIHTVVVAAMFRGDELIGTLNVITRHTIRSFSDDELSLLRGIASQAAVAIFNARMVEAAWRQSGQPQQAPGAAPFG